MKTEVGSPLLSRLRPWLRELVDEPTVIICGASALLIISNHQGSTGYLHQIVGGRLDHHPALPALGYEWWFGASVVLYMLVPLLISYATKGSFTRKYGLGLGDWRAGLKVSALFLLVMFPVTYLASKSTTFAGLYPLAGSGAYTLTYEGKGVVSWWLFLFYELGYVSYFVAWEFLFRGWMLNGLLPKFGRAGALLIPIAPFAVMHLGKAEPEALGSIVAALALGMLALRTRSMWYGVLVHASVAVYMDVISALPGMLPGL